jgi:hypothetical protein
MRRIGIIGAGQAGLYLGISLLEAGYQVTLFSDRTPKAIYNSQLKGAPLLFNEALQLERDLGLDFWKEDFLGCDQFCSEVCDLEGNLALVVSSPLEQPWQGIDQRLKFSLWMQEFVRRGGELIIQAMTHADLEECARNYDLVVVSAGRGAISSLFERDDEKSTYDKPQRHLAAMIVTGLKQSPKDSRTFKVSNLPSIGEIIQCSFYHKSQTAIGVIAFEACPGGVMDRFQQLQNGDSLLHIAKETIQEFLPWDYEKVKNAELADEQAWLRGAITPTVRKPIGRLSSGKIVMGIGDTVILNDPICGQGANSATKMAHLAAQRIIDRGKERFDESWMQGVFAEFWQYSQHVNAYANCLLQPPAHLQDIMTAMAENPEVVTDYINGVNHPPNLSPWFFEPEAAKEYLAEKNCLANYAP